MPIGFSLSDLVSTGGSVSDLQVNASDPKACSFVFTQSGDDEPPVTIPAGRFFDGAGNFGASASMSFVADLDDDGLADFQDADAKKGRR